MIKCEVCGKKLDSVPGFSTEHVLLTPDGDFACSDKCAKEWEKKRDKFFNEILPDDKKFASWLGVPESYL